MSEVSTRSVSLLAGRHVLIVEDEMIIAFDLSDIVGSFGCTSVMVGRIGKAVPLAATQAFDVGILDLNLAGEAVYPVAEELSRRGIPFVIATGYGADGIAAAYRDRPILAKPYAPRDVEAALLQALKLQRR
jgi:DNA-binding NtrC family response regulator